MKYLIFAFALFTALRADAQSLSLNEFLIRVSDSNQEVLSQKKNEEAYSLRISEGRLLTTVNFFASARTTQDRKQAQNPLFEGTERNQNLIEIGAEQPTSLLGINHRLYFAIDESELVGVDTTFITQPKVVRTSANYEFTLPVWRNAFGKTIRMQREMTEEQNRSTSLTSRYARKQIRVNAISTYWQLKATQDNMKLIAEMLEANETFLKWTRSRVRDRLAESTDLRQAEAAVELKKYELQSAEAELLQTQQNFNKLLQRDVSSPVELLDDFPQVIEQPLTTLTKQTLSREDLESLEALIKVNRAEAKIAAENTKAVVEFTGHLSSNGLDTRTNPSIDEAFTTKYPSATLGVRLSIPLDRGSVNRVQESATVRTMALESEVQRRRYEVLAEFQALERNFSQAMKVRDFAKSVENAQLAKYKTEQERRRTGRTSTFQLLSFQQEYQQARQSLIRAHSAALQLRAQFSLFEKNSEAAL